MPFQEQNNLIQHLEELNAFRIQEERLNIKEFEKWRANLLEELDGNYKIRVAKLVFYTYQVESRNDNDDLPF
jgi:hypothetical protein